MTRLARIEENDFAAQWLRETCQSNTAVVWTGYGLSFALSQVFANACRSVGENCISYSVRAVEMEIQRNIKTAYVSRSGCKPNYPVDFLIAQNGSDISWTKAPCLAVRDVDNGSDPWLSLEFTKQCLATFAESVEILFSPPNNPLGVSIEHKHLVFVFEKHCEPVKTLFETVGNKIDDHTLMAIQLREIGHGFHFELFNRPEDFCLQFCVSPENAGQWKILESWAKTVGISIKKEIVYEPVSEETTALENFSIGIAAVETLLSSRKDFPVDAKPIPENLDNLRQW